MNINSEIEIMTGIIKDAVPTDQIYLFGSYAYGVPNEQSDYDFYVVLSDDSVSPHDAIRKIYYALSKMGRRTPVDIIALSKDSFSERKEFLTLERKVANEGILLPDLNESLSLSENTDDLN